MVLVGYNKEQHVFLINFKYMTILLKRGVLVALMPQIFAAYPHKNRSTTGGQSGPCQLGTQYASVILAISKEKIMIFSPYYWGKKSKKSSMCTNPSFCMTPTQAFRALSACHNHHLGI